MRVYFRGQLGDAFKYERRVFFCSFPTEFGGHARDMFYVFFMAIGVLVTPFELTDDFQIAIAQAAGSEYFRGGWYEQLREIRHEQEGLRTRTLTFDWGG